MYYNAVFEKNSIICLTMQTYRAMLCTQVNMFIQTRSMCHVLKSNDLSVWYTLLSLGITVVLELVHIALITPRAGSVLGP